MRKEGMVNVEKLHDAEQSLRIAISAIITGLKAYLPEVWPPFSASDTPPGFFTDAEYERDGNTGHGSGLSRHVTVDDSFAAWQSSYEEIATEWTDFRFASFAGLTSLLDSFEFPGFFEEFGRGGRDYDRNEWRAGSVDVEALDGILAEFRERLAVVLDGLDPLLKTYNLGQIDDLLIFKLWDWETYTGFAEETLEVQAGTFADDPDYVDLCPHAPPSALAGRLWEGFAAEQLGKRRLAESMIESLQWWQGVDGAELDVAAKLSDVVRIWRIGSQTRRRGA